MVQPMTGEIGKLELDGEQVGGFRGWTTIIHFASRDENGKLVPPGYSYVVASAQVGCHNSKRKTHGQAMIVDPWGRVIAQCGDAPSPGFPTTISYRDPSSRRCMFFAPTLTP